MTTLAISGGRRRRYDSPMRPVLCGLAIGALFVGSFGFWSTTAPLASASIAQGKLEVVSNKKSVQHPYGGVVKRIFVKEGDDVVAGQTLLVLDDTAPRSKLDVLLVQRDGALAQEGRLIAERGNTPSPRFDASLVARKTDRIVGQLIANEDAVMAARDRQYRVETETLEKRLAELKAQAQGLQAELRGIGLQQALLAEERQGSETLYEQGFTPKTKILALDRNKAQLDTSRASKLASIAKTEQSMAAAKLDIAKAERTRTTGIADNLQKVEAKLAEIGPQIDAAQDVLVRTTVKAPASGTVVGLNVFTESGVIQAGAKMLDIVPEGTPLIAETKLPMTDLSDVAAGRRAEIRLTGVNRNERPNLYGTVLTVSADRVEDAKSAQPYYAMRVGIDPKDAARSKIKLQSGMPVEVVVSGKERTLLTYLAGPMIDEVTHAFREQH